MKNIFKSHLILILILFFSFSLHVYKLGAVPKILNPDEASIAYNALLLHETGKDEWGKTWSLVLDAFGDQKLIGYPFLVTIVFQVFGYADWVVRLPSVISGTILVYLAYVLQLKLGKSKKEAVLTAFMLCVIPVFFFYSRVAFEAMVALSFLLSGFILLLYSVSQKRLKNKIIFELLGLICFLFSLLTYNSPIILLPLVTSAFVIYQGVFNWRKWHKIVFFSAVIWVSFMIFFWPLSQQKSKITLFGDESTLQEFGMYRAQFNRLTSTVFGNKYIFFTQKMLVNYEKSWSPGFLLFNAGGHPWHAMPGFGYLYWTVYIFGLVGVLKTVYLFAKQFSHKEKVDNKQLAIFFLFITSLLPVIITVNAPQATRSLLFFFLWCFYASFGFIESSRYIVLITKRKFLNNALLLLFCLSIVLEAVGFLSFYFKQYAESNQLQAMFQPGFDTLINSVDNSYSSPVAIVDERGFNYILLAWYLKIPPDQFFSSIKKQLPDRINFKYGEQINQYHFIAKPTDRRSNERLVLEWNYSQNRWDTIYY